MGYLLLLFISPLTSISLKLAASCDIISSALHHPSVHLHPEKNTASFTDLLLLLLLLICRFMELFGWDGIQPIVANLNASSVWSSREAVNTMDHGFTNFGEADCVMNVASEVTSDSAGLMHSIDQVKEKDVSGFYAAGNFLFQQQQRNLSSSGSSMISDYVLPCFAEDHLSANGISHITNNAKSSVVADQISTNGCKLLMPSSAVSSRKRKASVAEDNQYKISPNPQMARLGQTEMIKFSNDVSKKRRTVGSNSLESMEYSSSSADCDSSGGFKLITAKASQQLPKSSNISFQLQSLSPDAETIAEMKEMIYRAASFRPVNLTLNEAVEKPKRKNVKISTDPQTAAARERRERISDRIRILQMIVPGGNKMDTATILDEAANYLKFLRSQVKALEKTAPAGCFGFSSFNFLP